MNEERKFKAMKSRGPRLIRDAVFSLVLTLMTLFAIAGVDHLPYSLARNAISDTLAWPGGLIAGFFYPQGVHTGRGSVGWAYVALAGNVAFYTLLWFFLIRMVTAVRQAGQRRSDA